MKHITLLLCLIGMTLVSCSSSDNDGEKTKNKRPATCVAVTPTLDCLPFYIAHEIGIDTQLGIELCLQQQSSVSDCDTAFINGSVSAAMLDYLHAEKLKNNWVKFQIDRLKDQMSKEKGKTKKSNVAARYDEVRKRAAKDSLYIYPHANIQLYFFTSSKSRISEAKQLADKVTGVDRNGVEALMARHVLDSVKLSDEKTFLVQMQNLKTRSKMLNVNTLDAAILPEPFATQARKAGHRSIYSATTVNGRKPGCLLVRGNQNKLREAYNRACDSINKNGIHRYDSVIVKHYSLPAEVVKAIPAHRFTKL